MTIRHATYDDLDNIENLYIDLTEHIEKTKNYAGWVKGIYPTRETAIKALERDDLFLLEEDNDLLGVVILNNIEDESYKEINWTIDASKDELIVIHTLAVSPNFRNKGVAKKFLNYTEEYARKNNLKTIRLDTHINNLPAFTLYESFGYNLCGTTKLKESSTPFNEVRCYDLVL